MPSDRFIPLKGISLDLADELMPNDMARFLKNVVYSPVDTSQTGSAKGSAAGVFKPLESVRVYDTSFSLPEGDNQFAGGFSNSELNQAYFFNYNSNGNHGFYLIDGESRTIQKIYFKDCLNIQLAPEHFIHEGGAWLEIFNYSDPATAQPKKRSYFMWVDGFNNFRFLCIEDSISTNSFSSTDFPYFIGNYDPCLLINAGVPTPLDCISVSEVPNTQTSKPNELKFHTWQFRITEIDVYGRPSEHGIISTSYIPGINDCIGSSDSLPRCLNLKFPIRSPLTDKVQVEFRNCNDSQWLLDTTLFLYNGSNLGDWWLRGRNPLIIYNSTTQEITYQFCKDKECNIIDQAETNRTQNPIPKRPQSVAKVGKQMALGNNRDGSNIFGNEAMDHISIEVIPPEDVADAGIRTAEIFVPAWNVYIGTQQPVYQIPGGQWVWGGRKDHTDDYVNNIVTDYQMYMGDPDRSGFIGYFAAAGTPPISTVSELYYVDDSNNMIKVEDFSIIHRATNNSPLFSISNYDRKYFHKFTFSNVAAATYIFRIADHKAKLSDPNFYTTSTYVAGQYSISNKQVNFFNRTSVAKELIVDLCSGNYNSLNDTKVLVIWDMTEPRTGGGLFNEPSRSKIVSGYVYAKKEDGAYVEPIELLNTNIYGDDNRNGNITDHNGFYFGSVRRDNGFDCEVFGFCSCVWKSLHRFRIESNDNKVFDRTFDLETTGTCHSYPNDECNRIVIKGRVNQCGTDIGVPGVGVVLSRGQIGITNSNGEFSIIAHDDAYIATHIRTDSIYYVPIKCALQSCDSICIPKYDIVINPCASCVTREILASNREVKFDPKKGQLSGGLYGVGLTGFDTMTRHTFIQTKDAMYVTMPSLIDTKTLAPSRLKLKINPAANFPLDITKLTISVTKELSLTTYIEWIVDKVEFIDNSGNENKIAPTQIKISYASLNEYNVQNNFNTTTHWQFIVQQTPQINYTSDFVEFYINGDGTFFPKLIRALVKYDQTGQYFLIDYDPALANLKQYALIRLGRPSDCVDRNSFYELCHSIDVVNGKAQQSEIILDAFDTYYLYRQIPIPIKISDDETENVIRTLGFPFEHNSPSDFWGQGCGNYGRINVRNPYEAEILKPMEIALSGGISVNGQLNYLNYFEDAQKTNFDSWDYGGITAIIPQPGLLLLICGNDAALVGFNDTIVRVNENGQVIVPSAESKFGNPQTKIGNNYGCSLFDKNTIRSREGLVQYLDSSKAYLIQHNYDNPKPITAGVIDSWLRPKIKYIQEWNRTHSNKKYFTGTIDPAANAYILSDHTIGSNSFLNEERGYNIETQESVSVYIYNPSVRAWFGFSPQGYVYLDTNLLEKQLFSFSNNNVYFHYTTDKNKTYGNIYGTPVEKIIRFVAVLDNIKKKQPLSLANYCVQSKYFADQIITDGHQLSRIMLDHFKFGNNFSAAPFLCNINTLTDPNLPEQTGDNKILDGDKLLGSVIDIRLVGDPSKNEVYSEYVGSTVSVFSQEKSGTPPIVKNPE